MKINKYALEILNFNFKRLFDDNNFKIDINSNYNHLKFTNLFYYKIVILLFHVTKYAVEYREIYLKEGVLLTADWLYENILKVSNSYTSDAIRLLKEWNILVEIRNANHLAKKGRGFQFPSNFNLDELTAINFDTCLEKTKSIPYVQNNLLHSDSIEHLIKNKLVSGNLFAVYQAYVISKLSIDNLALDEMKNMLGVMDINNSTLVPETTGNFDTFKLREIVKILNKNYRVTKAQGERLYSPFAMMPKSVRPFLILNGKRLIEIDISNCQLVILGRIIEMFVEDSKQSSLLDIKRFLEDGTKGEIYSNIAERAYLQDFFEDHNGKFKGLFMTIWYGGNKGFENSITDEDRKIIKCLRAAFQNLYPTIYTCLQISKGNSQRDTQKDIDKYKSLLAKSMQNIESQIMINTVSRKLIEKGMMFLNVHDAIYVSSEKDAKIVQKEIDNAFKDTLDLKVNAKTKIPPYIDSLEEAIKSKDKDDIHYQVSYNANERRKENEREIIAKKHRAIYDLKEFSRKIHKLSDSYSKNPEDLDNKSESLTANISLLRKKGILSIDTNTKYGYEKKQMKNRKGKASKDMSMEELANKLKNRRIRNDNNSNEPSD